MSDYFGDHLIFYKLVDIFDWVLLLWLRFCVSTHAWHLYSADFGDLSSSAITGSNFFI